MGSSILYASMSNDHWHIEHNRICSFPRYMSGGRLCRGSVVYDHWQCIWTRAVRVADGYLDLIPEPCQGTRDDGPIHHAHLQFDRSVRLLSNAERGWRRSG